MSLIEELEAARTLQQDFARHPSHTPLVQNKARTDLLLSCTRISLSGGRASPALASTSHLQHCRGLLQVQLSTYGDSLGKNIGELKQFIDQNLQGAGTCPVTAVPSTHTATDEPCRCSQ